MYIVFWELNVTGDGIVVMCYIACMRHNTRVLGGEDSRRASGIAYDTNARWTLPLNVAVIDVNLHLWFAGWNGRYGA